MASTSNASVACVNLDNLIAGQMIGSGSFTQVFVVKSTLNQENYALKIASMEAMPESHYDLIVEEVKNLRRLNHSGIISPLLVCTSHVNLCVLLPLMVHGSCDQIIANQFTSGFPENAIGIILRDILRAVEYLHKRNIIHCAIKASHILIGEAGQAVLSGFRFMTKIPEGQDKVYAADRLENMKMYLNWLSPEVLSQDQSGFDCQSDIYSIGILILELANGVVPYTQVSSTGLLVKKLQESYPRLWDKRFLPSHEQGACAVQDDDAGPSHRGGQEEQDRADAFDKLYKSKKYSTDIISLVKLCLIKNPMERPDCSGMSHAKFIKTYQNKPSSDVLKILSLTNPIELKAKEGDEAAPWLSFFSATEDITWNFSSPTKK